LRPVLEPIHWAPLREQTPLAHPLFAGYHTIVLCSLLTIPWLFFGFAVLGFASFVWQYMTKRFDSLTVPMVSHVLADLGIIIAAWFRT
jgi:membrane protease YdiL (CAAX protease family)